jgi:hypothetical protein
VLNIPPDASSENRGTLFILQLTNVPPLVEEASKGTLVTLLLRF